MNTRIVSLAALGLVGFALAEPQPAQAMRPLAFAANKTANILNRAAYRIDRHVMRPAHRVIVRHTR